MAIAITTHVANAIANLLTQFRETIPPRDSVKLRALLSILVDELQQVEDVSIEVLDERLIGVAEGVQLDRYGEIVGRKRLPSESDDDYRTILLVEIKANRADGGILVIIDIASELTGVAAKYTQNGQASYSVEWIVATSTPDSFIGEIVRIMEKLRPLGVDHRLVEGEVTAFQFDVLGAGFDLGKLGRRVDVL